MFKRVEKRIRRKEKEEELGIDDDMKEMLGMNDTDSDESDSSDSSGSDNGGDVPVRPEVESREEGEEGENSMAEEDELSDDDPEDDIPPMKLSRALQNPLYLVQEEPEVQGCIICPRKLFKNSVMIDVHLKSNAHTRRFSRFRDIAMDHDAETDVREILDGVLVLPQPEKQSTEGELSKRALKKKAKLEAIKVKKTKQRAMKAKHRTKREAKAKAEGAAGSDAESNSEDEAAPDPPPKKFKAIHTTDVDSRAPQVKQKPHDEKLNARKRRPRPLQHEKAAPMSRAMPPNPSLAKQVTTKGASIAAVIVREDKFHK
ncbi:uncharacterized protein BXZ73DRAFT_96342 [Epithele typhae]|uniref:uncharacterized protein n=1 Tax=Epithele typhae TaxID=378194 RepID=UPI002007ABEA|nr:uncharacterized protein BXZ73DRAFT_96342 [Epithele typhae]KAH9945351.1 hypothetical protein BXZ73DRAFT_96342 [Epithele typhae]